MSPRSRTQKRALAGALIVWLLAAASAPPAQDPAAPGPDPDPLELLEQAQSVRRELLRVDARLAFDPKDAARALEAIATERDPRLRNAAILTLGAARAVASRPHLALWAQEGPEEQRQAALFALGEMGSRIADGEAVLMAALEDENPTLAASALIALYRTGIPRSTRFVKDVAEAPAHPLNAVARSLLAFEEDQLLVPPHPAIVSAYELRRDAAKWFGTIDGKTWRMRLVDELRRDESFLDHIVLLSAADVDLPGVKDHLLEILLTERRPVRIRAAVRAMPSVVERLIENDLWAPVTPGEWRVLLESAVEEGVAERMPVMLERASRLPPLAPIALGILAEGGKYDEFLLSALQSKPARRRANAAFAIGEGGLDHLLPHLVDLGSDAVVQVRAAAYAARVRLGDAGGAQGLRRMLVEERGDYSPADRLVVIEALHAASRSILVLDLVSELARELEGLEQAGLIATIHLRRRTVDMSPLRDVLEGIDLDTPLTRRMVEALGYLPKAEDLAWLARRFPIENGGEGNVALGLALARNGHPKVESILQHAVWSEPWNRSVLAAAVVKERSGMRVLEHWVTKPPASATSEDIRRLGFAIGEWGGLEAVEHLSRRLGSNAGADRPALQGAVLGALSTRTQ